MQEYFMIILILKTVPSRQSKTGPAQREPSRAPLGRPARVLGIDAQVMRHTSAATPPVRGPERNGR
eukprot:scaffold712_cov404-Prasinococcus_capsulatus_cf.AAC.1